MDPYRFTLTKGSISSMEYRKCFLHMAKMLGICPKSNRHDPYHHVKQHAHSIAALAAEGHQSHLAMFCLLMFRVMS